MKRLMIWGIGLMTVGIASVGYGQGAPVVEIPGNLLTYMQQIKEDSNKNKEVNQKRLDLYKEWEKKLLAISRTAQQMSMLSEMDNHVSLLKDGEGTSLDANVKGNGSADEALKLIELDAEYAVMDAKIVVPKAILEPPRWMEAPPPPPPDGNPPPTAFWERTHSLLVKAAARVQVMRRSDDLEAMTYGVAQTLLPRSLLKNFNPQATVSYLLGKAGIVELGEGIYLRPTVAQDWGFAKYANLGCGEDEELLFWSDPMVTDGYHPVVGTALNQTALKGAKIVDMDNVISQGRSKQIDQWNRLQPPKKQVMNPFRGYAAKVMPGLMVMGERGQLGDGAPLTSAQLTEAMRLTKQVRLLPSQQVKVTKSGFRGDTVVPSLEMFHFAYPARIIKVAGTTPPPSNDQTATVELSKLDKETLKKRMELDKKRLEEIAKLKKANQDGRKYANKIVESYLELDQQAAGVAAQMDQDSAIPQISEFRKRIEASVENYRWMMSNLSYQYDDLLHREWAILQHVLNERKKATYQLMDNAGIRYRSAMTAMGQDQSSSGSSTPSN